MRAAERVLASATRCVLAVAGAGGPIAAPSAFWTDRAHLWLPVPAAAEATRELRRSPACAAYVPPVDPETPGALVRGVGRVFRVGEPLRLALHAPAISGALVGLATRELAGLGGGHAPPAADVLSGALRPRAVVRVAIEDVAALRPAVAGGGIAPALPAVVPPEVRRALAGKQRIVVVAGAPGTGRGADGAGSGVGGGVGGGAGGETRWAGGFPELTVASWRAGAAGIAIESVGAPASDDAPSGEPAGGAPVSCLCDPGLDDGRLGEVGVEVRGLLSGGEVAPTMVRWWRGPDAGRAEVPAPSAGGVELPE